MIPIDATVGLQMISSIEIDNFRCFQHLKIENCKKINIIVGDNGTGKTALLEAIFLALGSSPEIAVRFRTQRGLDSAFSGPPIRIEEALWNDLFYDSDPSHQISIALEGKGDDARSVRMFKGSSTLSMSFSPQGTDEVKTGPLSFVWRNSKGEESIRSVKITQSGIQFEGIDEDLPDHFYYASNQTIPALENASRFSDLSRSGRAKDFVQQIIKEYTLISDLRVEVIAGSPILYATLSDKQLSLPLPLVSGGINRIVTALLTIASRSHSTVLIDEIEDGIYYKHQGAVWRTLLSFAQRYNSQIFLTTHNEEWLTSLFENSSDILDDIVLWRMERKDGKPVLHRFSGKQAAAANTVGEIR